MKNFEEEYLSKVGSDEIAEDDGFSLWVDFGITKGDWLEDAFEIEPQLASHRPSIDKIVDFLWTKAPGIPIGLDPQERSRNKYALKMVLINLWISHQRGVPVFVSRHKNHYSTHRRYGSLYFKYARMMAILDALVDGGFIYQFKGFRDKDTQYARRTRIYPKKILTNFFDEADLDGINFIEHCPPDDVIQLKNHKKEDIKNFPETEFTRSSRARLEQYNEFITNNEVVVRLNTQTPVSYSFLNNLCHKSLDGQVSLIQLETGHITGTVPQDKVYINYLCKPQNNTKLLLNLLNTQYLSMTGTWTLIDDVKVRRAKRFQKVNEEKPLEAFGLSAITFSIKYKSLYRVFNNGSFECGGRHYGAYYQKMAKEWRKDILINGSPVVEPDYSGHHIRMLYNLENLSYLQDPYRVVCKCQDEHDDAYKRERKLFKLLLLVAINAENEGKMVKGFCKELKSNQLSLPKGLKVVDLLDRFKDAHKPIQKYLCSGMGTTLQFLDSEITQNILDNLMNKGISCFPIFDSYIVEARHVGKAEEAMDGAYEQVMKFKPVIKVG